MWFEGREDRLATYRALPYMGSVSDSERTAIGYPRGHGSSVAPARGAPSGSSQGTPAGFPEALIRRAFGEQADLVYPAVAPDARPEGGRALDAECAGSRRIVTGEGCVERRRTGRRPQVRERYERGAIAIPSGSARGGASMSRWRASRRWPDGSPMGIAAAGYGVPGALLVGEGESVKAGDGWFFGGRGLLAWRLGGRRLPVRFGPFGSRRWGRARARADAMPWGRRLGLRFGFGLGLRFGFGLRFGTQLHVQGVEAGGGRGPKGQRGHGQEGGAVQGHAREGGDGGSVWHGGLRGTLRRAVRGWRTGRRLLGEADPSPR